MIGGLARILGRLLCRLGLHRLRRTCSIHHDGLEECQRCGLLRPCERLIPPWPEPGRPLDWHGPL